MHDMFILDMGGHDDNVRALQERFPHARVTRYHLSHIAAINRCMKHARTKRAWIISSCCDYSDFDFEWEPAPWEAYQLHCWASGDQKMGDTFSVPRREWGKASTNTVLEWYHDVNYHADGVPRLPWPVVVYAGTDLIAALNSIEMAAPYSWFVPNHLVEIGTGNDPAMWVPKDHLLTSFSRDNSINLVPKLAKDCLENQVYDWPHLRRIDQVQCVPQDIIFISYDETNADENWETLRARYPSAKRVHGINGMERALRVAARRAETPWFYAVFAKTRLHEDWRFDHQPDYWLGARHYIFYARNMSNDLVYGEMGVIMYHRQLVLDSPPFDQLGLDFTMSSPTVVIPRMSCYGEFATDPYRAWRTAFRECCKLAHWQATDPCVETEYRLHVWTTQAHGPNAEWVLRGARDGRDYHARHQGSMEDLKKTFRWEWLQEYYSGLYGSDKNSAIASDT